MTVSVLNVTNPGREQAAIMGSHHHGNRFSSGSLLASNSTYLSAVLCTMWPHTIASYRISTTSTLNIMQLSLTWEKSHCMPTHTKFLPFTFAPFMSLTWENTRLFTHFNNFYVLRQGVGGGSGCRDGGTERGYTPLPRTFQYQIFVRVISKCSVSACNCLCCVYYRNGMSLV